MRRAIVLLLVLTLVGCITKDGSISMPSCVILCRAHVGTDPPKPEPSVAASGAVVPAR